MEMIKLGPVGERSGGKWDEKGRDEVAGIFVSYTKDTIESLQFLFHENGNLVQSKKHGSNRCENFCAVVFDYPSEFLTSLSGFFGEIGYSTALQAIQFHSNKGCYGPFGRTQAGFGSKHFNFHVGNHRLFGGFHGTKSHQAVQSIGIYVKPFISSMINLKGLRLKDEKEED